MSDTTAPQKAKTEIVTVTMEDGRLVDFAGKKKLQKESLTNGSQVQVRLDFRNGQTRLFTLPDALLQKFAAHGAEQKLGDEIAGLDDIDDCVLAVDELIDRLYNGEFNAKRATGDGLSGTSVLVKALAELYQGKQTIDGIKAYLKGKSHAEKVALRNNPKVKPIVERIEAEKAAKNNKVDTNALLAELDG